MTNCAYVIRWQIVERNNISDKKYYQKLCPKIHSYNILEKIIKKFKINTKMKN